jgi:cell division septation protein DedD
MTQTEGEHELVLGNKQLLSAFFLVVILLGVSFTMGYFVGRNTAASGFNAGQTAAGAGGQRPDAVGKPLDSGTPSQATPAPDSTTPAADANAAPTDSKPAPETPAPPVEARRETPPPAEKPASRPEEASETMASPSSEQMYLQVFALRRPDADNQVKLLRNHGFPALLGESSKEGIYRVLVGPFKTNGEMGRTKTALKAKGFDSIVAK